MYGIEIKKAKLLYPTPNGFNNYLKENNFYVKEATSFSHLIYENYQFAFLVTLNEEINTKEKGDSLFIMKQFLLKEFSIPLSQQYIFEWDNNIYDKGIHYLVETSEDSCSFLLLKLESTKFFIVPTSITGKNWSEFIR
ncbi:hypothetical protein C3943_21745 [Lysinibacillus sp. B2A1]|nr:hypothetical protein C3943_21745 [Lysinibacillus sp. B2A1]